jgi:hypothetical protein
VLVDQHLALGPQRRQDCLKAQSGTVVDLAVLAGIEGLLRPHGGTFNVVERGGEKRGGLRAVLREDGMVGYGGGHWQPPSGCRS